MREGLACARLGPGGTGNRAARRLDARTVVKGSVVGVERRRSWLLSRCFVGPRLVELVGLVISGSGLCSTILNRHWMAIIVTAKFASLHFIAVNLRTTALVTSLAYRMVGQPSANV